MISKYHESYHSTLINDCQGNPIKTHKAVNTVASSSWRTLFAAKKVYDNNLIRKLIPKTPTCLVGVCWDPLSILLESTAALARGIWDFGVRAPFFGFTRGDVCIPVDVVGGRAVCVSIWVFVGDGKEGESDTEGNSEVSDSWGCDGSGGKSSNPDNFEDILMGVVATVSGVWIGRWVLSWNSNKISYFKLYETWRLFYYE